MKRLGMVFLLCFAAAAALAGPCAAETLNYLPDLNGEISLLNASELSGGQAGGEKTLELLGNQRAYFDIADGLFYLNPGQKAVELRITYYDAGPGYFTLLYDSKNGPVTYKDYEETYGTQNKITRAFYLTDARCGNGGPAQSDFVLSYYTAAAEPLKLLNASVTLSDKRIPAEIKISTDAPGNVFFDGEPGAFQIGIEDAVCSDKIFVDYEILNIETNAVCMAERRTYQLRQGIRTEDRFIPAVTEYGSYALRAVISDEQGLYEGAWEYPFSICVKNSKGNPNIGVVGHFGLGREYINGLKLLGGAGFGLLREGYRWNESVDANGIFTASPLYAGIVQEAEKNGLRVLEVAGYNNTNLYPGTDDHDMPDTDGKRAAFADFVYRMLASHTGEIDMIEVWNEPNLKKFNLNSYQDPTVYAKLLKAVYERVHPDFPNVKICGISQSSIGAWYTNTWMKAVFDTDTDLDGIADGYQYMDAIAVHHYYTPGDLSVIDDLSGIDSLLAEYGCADMPLLHTEFGMSQAAEQDKSIVVKSEREQAVGLSKYLLTLSAYRWGEKLYLYDFSNDGLAENEPESNFGLTHNMNSIVPYAAKSAFLAVSNINNLLNDCEGASVVRDDTAAVYRFENAAKGKVVYSLYSRGGNRNYLLQDPGGNISFFDLYGNPFRTVKTLNGYELTLTEEPVFAVSVPNSVSVTSEWDGSSLRVTGTFNTAAAGEQVGIKVFDQFNQLVYVDQLRLDRNKACNFSIPNLNQAYNHTVWFGMESMDGIYTVGIDGQDGIFFYVQTESGQPVHSISQLINGENGKACVRLSGNKARTFSVICALYRQDRLLDIKRVYSGDMTWEDGIYTSLLDSKLFLGADAVKFYLWDSLEGMSPLAGFISIKDEIEK